MPTFSVAGASLAHPYSVSTSRSSNRTCGTTASGFRTRHHAFAHGKLRVSNPFALACSAARSFWIFSGGCRLMPLSWSLAPSCARLEPWLLPSAGITRLQRYYGPIRHPTRASLSLTGFRLVVTRHHRWGFPCCTDLLVHACPRQYPGGIPGSPVAHSPRDGSLPRYRGGSAPALNFSRPARRSLVLRPTCSLSRFYDPFPSEAPADSLPPLPLRLLPAGATPCRAGFSPAEDQHLSRRTRYPSLWFK